MQIVLEKPTNSLQNRIGMSEQQISQCTKPEPEALGKISFMEKSFYNKKRYETRRLGTQSNEGDCLNIQAVLKNKCLKDSFQDDLYELNACVDWKFWVVCL